MDSGSVPRLGQGATYNNSDYGVNDQGERIILGTRRADGTYRKEKKVRAGYVPPDEQVAYVSRGKQWRLEAEKEPVPGFEGDIILPENSSPAKPLSKSAKKNAARRAKKASDGNEGATATQCAAQPAKGQQQQPVVNGSNGGANEPENEQDAKEKKIRALRKKLRQCEQLEEKKSGGAELTPEQEEKLANVKDLNNAATNAAAAKYLASLQLNGSSDLAAARAAGQFVHQLQQQHYHHQQQQHHHQQQQQQQSSHQAPPKVYKGVQRHNSVTQESRSFGEHSDGSVPFVTPHSYHTAQPSYPGNTAHTQLRPAAADSRAHMHLQFGNHTISPMKEAPVQGRRFSTGVHQWEDADPSLVAALYNRFFDGNAMSKPDRRLSTGHVVSNGGMTDQQRYHRVSGNRHAAVQAVQPEQRRPYLPHPSELGPGWS